MKLSQFRDLLAVVEFGSLRGAGRHLGIAQPVITRSIRELERELGVSLFERHAKGVQLTDMGQAFVRRVESFQSELRRAKEEIGQLKGKMTGEVTVALSTASCMALMPSAVAAFQRRYPDATLKISETLFQPVEADLSDGKIDFWIGPLDQTGISSKFAVERLFDNHRRVVARKGHILADARSLKDLTEARWVRPTLSTRSTEGDFDAMFDRLGLPSPKIVLHARSALITILIVANSDLLTVLPQQWLDFAPMRDLYQALDLIEPMVAAPMCIVQRKGMPLTPMAEYLCDRMRTAAAQYERRQAGTVEL
ncbi:LysR substrate-binding domain-containing protein [uncultured Sphingomonas sp.]|uniref:LysR substrate-binding domain-containing protein n=1 Tax=uncultured Sphingomonas sp. TaxID=158754 RepID=UPI0035CA0ADA